MRRVRVEMSSDFQEVKTLATTVLVLRTFVEMSSDFQEVKTCVCTPATLPLCVEMSSDFQEVKTLHFFAPVEFGLWWK